ncbi:hypothetical protein HanIR_Chr07g0312391 [Helianthus annuus]|nr:hypothetical protein HanIR_Chr07g0312391 [Helianthus annuus]
MVVVDPKKKIGEVKNRRKRGWAMVVRLSAVVVGLWWLYPVMVGVGYIRRLVGGGWIR